MQGYVFYKSDLKLKEIQIYSGPEINEENFLCFYSFKELDFEANKYNFNFIIKNISARTNLENIFIYFIDQNNSFTRLEHPANLQFDYNSYPIKNLNFEERCIQMFNYKSNSDSIVYFMNKLITSYEYYPFENVKDYTVLSNSFRNIFREYLME